MISPLKARIYISLPKTTIADLDKVRGSYTRSEMIDTAIQMLIASLLLYEAEKEAPAEDLEKEKHKC